MNTAQLTKASSEQQLQLIASPWHTLMVVVIALVNVYRASIYAAQARAGLGTSRSYLYLRVIAFEFAVLAVGGAGIVVAWQFAAKHFERARWRSRGQML
jgi:hypothetical protein